MSLWFNCLSTTENTDNSSAVNLPYISTVSSPTAQVKKKMKFVFVSVCVTTKDKGTKLTCDTLLIIYDRNTGWQRPQQISVDTQCNLLDARLLQRLPQVTSLDDSFVIKIETGNRHFSPTRKTIQQSKQIMWLLISQRWHTSAITWRWVEFLVHKCHFTVLCSGKHLGTACEVWYTVALNHQPKHLWFCQFLESKQIIWLLTIHGSDFTYTWTIKYKQLVAITTATSAMNCQLLNSN